MVLRAMCAGTNGCSADAGDALHRLESTAKELKESDVTENYVLAQSWKVCST